MQQKMVNAAGSQGRYAPMQYFPHTVNCTKLGWRRGVLVFWHHSGTAAVASSLAALTQHGLRRRDHSPRAHWALARSKLIHDPRNSSQPHPAY